MYCQNKTHTKKNKKNLSTRKEFAYGGNNEESSLNHFARYVAD